MKRYRINWGVRMRNKRFWLTLVPAMSLLIQLIAEALGYSIESWLLEQKLMEVINVIFAVMSILGIIVDPTTKGFSDSEQAMTYKTPKEI